MKQTIIDLQGTKVDFNNKYDNILFEETAVLCSSYNMNFLTEWEGWTRTYFMQCPGVWTEFSKVHAK